MTIHELARTADLDIPEVVLSAARRCFHQYGVDRVTMDDIAKEAGIGRTTLYRMGLSRHQLTVAALVARAEALVEALLPAFERDLPFGELLVDGSVAVLEAARSDEELLQLVRTCEALELNSVLGLPSPVIHQLTVKLFAPCFERGRRNKEMRTDVSDDRAADWVRSIYVMLALRDDLSAEEERAMLQDFLLPSLRA